MQKRAVPPSIPDTSPAVQHLRITIGNEAQNGPVARTSATHVGNHTQGGRSVGTHAVDHLVCQIRWEYVCLKQLRVRTMGPLLRTRAFLCEGIAKDRKSTRLNSS